MTNEKTIQKIYTKLFETLGCHNHIVESKSMWKYCIDCKKKALTISQPTDQVTRFVDYRIICFSCNTTQIIQSNQYSKKQDLNEFIFDLMNHFQLN